MTNKIELNNNEINFKNFIKISKEEDFLKSFSFIFSKKESNDDIKFENDIYFFKYKSYDMIKSNKKIRNDIDCNEFLPKQNELKIINKKAEKDISKNNINISLYRNHHIDDKLDSKENQKKDLIIENSKNKEKVTNFDSKNFLNKKEKIWIRGPYKKKKKIIQKTNIDDKCFPFTSGQGLIKLINNKGLQIINELKNSNQKEINQKIINNIFTTNHYNKDSKEKVKKAKKQRKFKSDDIRKKIKVKFHKAIKNIINENLKKAGSEELFTFLPQSFLGNISKIFNKKYMNLTYQELLTIDFTEFKKDNIGIDMEKRQIIKNKNVLQYLKNNPEISKISGYDIIKNMKYKDLFQLYFSSKEFENTIIQLKNKNESIEYIDSYIKLAKDYINFFSDSSKYTIKIDKDIEK